MNAPMPGGPVGSIAAVVGRIAGIEQQIAALGGAARPVLSAAGVPQPVFRVPGDEPGAASPTPIGRSATGQSTTGPAMPGLAMPGLAMPGLAMHAPFTPVEAGTPYAALFDAAGARHGVPPRLLAAMAHVESRFRTDVVSPAGAVGLMQFLPSTAAAMGVDPLDPASAIDGAARYIAEQLERFGSLELAVAAYNIGPGALAQQGGIVPGGAAERYVRAVEHTLENWSAATARATRMHGPLTMQVDLTGEGLGPLVAEATVDAGALHVELAASTPSTVELIDAHRATLRHDLQHPLTPVVTVDVVHVPATDPLASSLASSGAMSLAGALGAALANGTSGDRQGTNRRDRGRSVPSGAQRIAASSVGAIGSPAAQLDMVGASLAAGLSGLDLRL